MEKLDSVNALLLEGGGLVENFGIKGQKWIKQLVFGFPIIGVLSLSEGVYPLDNRVNSTIIDNEGLLDTARRRFSERATGSTTPHCEELWAESLEQCKKGRLGPLKCPRRGTL